MKGTLEGRLEGILFVVCGVEGNFPRKGCVEVNSGCDSSRGRRG